MGVAVRRGILWSSERGSDVPRGTSLGPCRGLTRHLLPGNMCRMTESTPDAATQARATPGRSGFSLPGVDAIPALDDLSGDPTSANPYETAQVMTPPPAAVDDQVGVTNPDNVAGATQPTTTATAPTPFARPLPRTIAIANQKGGVGKTTTAVNLGACLAELGFRTLVIDLDPQGNASTGLGIENRGLDTSMYHVIMHEVPLEDCIEPSAVRNLFVAPASLDLAGAEIELVPAFSRENRLRRAIGAVSSD